MSGPASLSAPDAQGLRTLRLQRPGKANALSAELVEALHDRLDALGPETRALLIRGDGRHFCGGFDFEGCASQTEGELLLRFVRIDELLARLRAMGCLTLAWVSGAAIGAGADIACACAVRIGAPSARLRFPGFQFGVALGTRRLATLVGAERARRILLRNEELDAAAALQCGLLTETADDEAALAGRVEDWLSATRRLDAPALRALYALTDADLADRDLAALVRSLARPGLHARIAAYRSG